MSYDPNPSNLLKGWECPRCGRIWSPFTQSCSCVAPTNTTTVPIIPVPLKCSQCGGGYVGSHICVRLSNTSGDS